MWQLTMHCCMKLPMATALLLIFCFVFACFYRCRLIMLLFPLFTSQFWQNCRFRTTHSQISMSFIFQTNWCNSKRRWHKMLTQNRAILTPVKFRPGTDLMSEWIFEGQFRSQHLIYILAAPVRLAWSWNQTRTRTPVIRTGVYLHMPIAVTTVVPDTFAIWRTC